MKSNIWYLGLKWPAHLCFFYFIFYFFFYFQILKQRKGFEFNKHVRIKYQSRPYNSYESILYSYWIYKTCCDREDLCWILMLAFTRIRFLYTWNKLIINCSLIASLLMYCRCNLFWSGCVKLYQNMRWLCHVFNFLSTLYLWI